jgi:hypothetical protein
LNIVVQGTWGKKKLKEKDPKGTPKTLIPSTWLQNPDGNENLEGD